MKTGTVAFRLHAPFVWLLCCSLLMIQAIGCGPASEQGPQLQNKVIKLSHSHPADFSSEIHTAAWIFQQWVNDHSATLRVKIYSANQLGEEREVYEGMQLGSGASCAITGTAILNNFAEKVGVLDLPFLWADYEHVHQVLDGEVGKMLAGELDKVGLKVLVWMDSWGARNVVTASRPVTSPDDLQGLKIRTIPTPTYIAALDAMGANPTPMAFGEVYTSLQTGVIDGFEHSAAVILASKFYEVGKHMALTRHLFGPLVFCFSKQEWDRLDKEEQQVIMEAALMARDVQRSLAPLREQEALDALESKGMTMYEIDVRPFHERAQVLQDTLAEEVAAADLLHKIRTTGKQR